MKAFFNSLLSSKAVRHVAGYWADGDDETPPEASARLKQYLDEGRYATALRYLFEMVWDKGWEG